MAKHILPNTFIMEDGQIIFFEEEKIPKDQLDCLNACNSICRRMEERYETADIFEMMRNGASRKELIQYMDSKHSLMVWGYD